MPAETTNKRPVIVYLNEDDYQKLWRLAAGESLSATARRLLHAQLEQISFER